MLLEALVSSRLVDLEEVVRLDKLRLDLEVVVLSVQQHSLPLVWVLSDKQLHSLPLVWVLSDKQLHSLLSVGVLSDKQRGLAQQGASEG